MEESSAASAVESFQIERTPSQLKPGPETVAAPPTTAAGSYCPPHIEELDRTHSSRSSIFDEGTEAQLAISRPKFHSDLKRSSLATLLLQAVLLIATVFAYVAPPIVINWTKTVGYDSKSKPIKGDTFLEVSVVVFSKTTIVVMAFCLALYWDYQEGGHKYWGMLTNFRLVRPWLLIGGGYAIADVAEIMANGRIDGATYAVLSQSRLVGTALAMRCIVGKERTYLQWSILFNLSLVLIGWQLTPDVFGVPLKVPKNWQRLNDTECINPNDVYTHFHSLEECQHQMPICMWNCNTSEFRGLASCTRKAASICGSYIERSKAPSSTLGYTFTVFKMVLSIVCGVLSQRVLHEGSAMPLMIQQGHMCIAGCASTLILVPIVVFVLYPAIGQPWTDEKGNPLGFFGGRPVPLKPPGLPNAGEPTGWCLKTFCVLGVYIFREVFCTYCIHRFDALVKNLCNAAALICTYAIAVNVMHDMPGNVVKGILAVAICLEIIHYGLAEPAKPPPTPEMLRQLSEQLPQFNLARQLSEQSEHGP